MMVHALTAAGKYKGRWTIPSNEWRLVLVASFHLLSFLKITYICTHTYIPLIRKCVTKTVGCGTSHKYTNIQIYSLNTTNILQNGIKNYFILFFSTLQQPYWAKASSLSRIYDHTQTHHTQ